MCLGEISPCHKHPKPFNRPFSAIEAGKAGRQGRQGNAGNAGKGLDFRVYFWVWKIPLSALSRLVASQKGINLEKGGAREGHRRDQEDEEG
jgi:hypothetical protein